MQSGRKAARLGAGHGTASSNSSTRPSTVLFVISGWRQASLF
jgi:hypothetical protein